ncbi:amidohydrolase family protein [Sphingomonas sinipercae]|uniref:Amidohydrolase family protein n=1 Tax=Sphingomonas sinipercae TaxID=2714944 RepID=A0A6G7ZPW4_9SPHN|nr:amidohydrolase [Sphingomonas sinipercae]QIL03024.1 amidohydrolase family protein [Sphingomonas sinipercae]
MNKTFFALAAALLSSAAQADTLIDNVNGIQIGADGKLQRFKAIVIGDDGKVRQLLEHPELVRLANITRHVDGGGKTLLPGLIDAHGHVFALGYAALTLDLVGTSSVQDLQGRLKAYAAGKRNGWIVGRGWNQELWPDQRFPTAADLDAVVGDRPVVLERVDGHAVVANTAALKAAGITAATKNPVGGKIERDANGQATGLLIDSASALVSAKVPAPTEAERERALAEAQKAMLAVGLTAAADMGMSVPEWGTIHHAGMDGKLQVRIMAYAAGVEPIATFHAPTQWLFGDRLRMGGVKLYADGALGSRGAWLKAPYADKPDTRGLRFHSDAEMFGLAKRAADAGFQVAIHAIGDAANAQELSIFERLSKIYPGDRRWRIEHAQIVDPRDTPRFAPARIIASMQPVHQTSDRLMAEKRLGPGRLDGAYAWQTVLQSGARLAFGSDFPVESPNPFPGLAAATSRQDMSGEPAGGWLPRERVSFAQALDGFTRGAAYAGFAEGKIGSLEPGKWADFILVDRDVSSVDAQNLARTQVLETWIAGKPVWTRAASARGERGK